jgi:hypothetical protein
VHNQRLKLPSAAILVLQASTPLQAADVSVAVGDVTNDGLADIVIGATIGNPM